MFSTVLKYVKIRAPVSSFSMSPLNSPQLFQLKTTLLLSTDVFKQKSSTDRKKTRNLKKKINRLLKS